MIIGAGKDICRAYLEVLESVELDLDGLDKVVEGEGAQLDRGEYVLIVEAQVQHTPFNASLMIVF